MIENLSWMMPSKYFLGFFFKPIPFFISVKKKKKGFTSLMLPNDSQVSNSQV